MLEMPSPGRPATRAHAGRLSGSSLRKSSSFSGRHGLALVDLVGVLSACLVVDEIAAFSIPASVCSLCSPSASFALSKIPICRTFRLSSSAGLRDHPAPSSRQSHGPRDWTGDAVLVGPTAVGKSRLAVALARRLIAAGRPAEVVNADSMLVYRGMDIGTAKPTPAERGGVRHHLIDVLDVRQTATVAEFQRLARAGIADCRRRDGSRSWSAVRALRPGDRRRLRVPGD